MPRRVDDILAHTEELAARFESYDPRPEDELDKVEHRSRTPDGRQTTDSGYTDIKGVRFTDEDIEQSAAVNEPEEGYTDGHLGPSRPNKPNSRAGDPSPATAPRHG